MKEFKILINEQQQNKRIDIALSEVSEYSRSMIQKLIYNKKISLNEKIIEKPNYKTQLNDIYIITPIQNSFLKITPEPYDLEILYEDEFLIVLNKPAELIVHPGSGNFNNTLINKLAHHCKLSNIAGPERLGTVHRLDKGVSGCIIFAKDNITHANLNEQFANRTIKKQYIAITHNTLTHTEKYIENFITRSLINRQKMMVSHKGDTGKLAQMNLKIEKIINYNNQKLSLIKCYPITGRMHQIRVQLSNINLPILNDKLYGKTETIEIKNIFQNRIALHSNNIQFIHPKTNEKISIDSNLPNEFTKILN